ncbi:hypothetical protein JNO48_02355 [Clostridiales bacterium]|nr:hypothetical protein JNO48_02355 [Clostridiales bacterium]
MKRSARNFFLKGILVVLMVCLLVPAVMAEGAETEEAPLYRTDVTEEDFIGTWNLVSMVMEGYQVPTVTLGLKATVVVTPGKIEITDVLGVQKTYDTTFADGVLSFVNDKEEPLIVYITPEGLLHVDQKADTFSGEIDDEKAPEKAGGTTLNMAMANLNANLLAQYFEKAAE